MDPLDRASYVKRYEERLHRHGYSPEALGWGRNGRQEFRFSILSADILVNPMSSVLDVGCGFADLYEFLRARGWSGRYVGIDLVPALLDVARARHPKLDLRLADLVEISPGTERFEYVVASGIFNAKLVAESNTTHVERSLGQMFDLCDVAMMSDFLSTHVDFQHETAWHADPAWAAGVAAQLSQRFALRHDYMPYEFALTVYRRAEVSWRNVFKSYDASEPTSADIDGGANV
jgi:SAM-dependent methyltransferase